MFHSLLIPPRIRAVFFYTCVFSLGSACSVAVNGQARRGVDMDANNVGNGGAATITGRIYYPGGRPFDQRVAVRLQSISGEQIAFSNENGAFTFARLSAGTYSVQLDAGKEYETARETVEVRGPRRNAIGSGEIVPVYINLKLKVTTVEKAGTIDANLAGVPDAALKLYKEAKTLAQSGEKTRAIELLDKAIEKDPEFMMAYNEKGVQYLQLNQPQKAIEPLEAAIKLSPEAFQPRINYGIALLQSGRPISSVLELRQALQNHDSSCRAHLYLGLAYLSVALNADAEGELQRALKIGGDESVVAHRYLGGLYAIQGDKVRAAEELETYMRLAPKAAEAEHIRVFIETLHKGAQANK
jgi:tetratricopeptide (TPR) repeat protein